MKTYNHSRFVPVLAAVCVLALTLISARASFIALGRTNYFQDFNTLVQAGKSKSLPLGWATGQIGTQDSSYIYADNGSSQMSRVYSYGNTGSGNRAIGVIDDPANLLTFGANFQNTSGSTISRLFVSFTGEEWRLGATGRGQGNLQFQYSLNAGSLNSGTWNNVSALDFLTPNLTGVGAHDGTLAANQTQISGTVSFLNIPVGSTFWVRWVDAALPGGGPQDGLAIDNFSLTAVPEVSTMLAAIAATAFLGIVLWKKRGSQPRSLSMA